MSISRSISGYWSWYTIPLRTPPNLIDGLRLNEIALMPELLGSFALSGSLALWLSGSLAPGSLALWHSGSLALWLSGSLHTGSLALVPAGPGNNDAQFCKLLLCCTRNQMLSRQASHVHTCKPLLAALATPPNRTLYRLRNPGTMKEPRLRGIGRLVGERRRSCAACVARATCASCRAGNIALSAA